MEWATLSQFLGGSALFFAALAWVTRSTISHFFSREMEQHKARLTAANEKEIAQLQHQLAVEFERFRGGHHGTIAKQERIRTEILRWANPILDSVNLLHGRLNNILKHNGYVALRKDFHHVQWSVDYEYFMSATLYAFASYFFWTESMHRSLSFELFEKQEDKDAFFAAIHSVSRKLRSYPVKSYSCNGADFQVFALQQRAIGEAMADSGDPDKCMSYHRFLTERQQAPLCDRLTPLANLLEDLTPSEDCRWKRLLATYTALDELREHCRNLLSVDALTATTA